jgi:hypothetical protein
VHPRATTSVPPIPAVPPLSSAPLPRLTPRASATTPLAVVPAVRKLVITPTVPFLAVPESPAAFDAVTSPETPMSRLTRPGDDEPARPGADGPAMSRLPLPATPTHGAPSSRRAGSPSDAVPPPPRSPRPDGPASGQRASSPSGGGLTANPQRASSPSGPLASPPRKSSPRAAVPARATPPMLAAELSPSPQGVPLPLPAPIESARIVAPRIEERALSPMLQRDSGESPAAAAPGAAPSRRRLLWIAAASVCVAGAIVLVVLDRTGSAPGLVVERPVPRRAVVSEPPPPPPQEAVTTDQTAAAPEPVAAAAPPPAEPAPPEPPPAREVSPTRAPAPRPVRRRRAAIKPLIVEYNDRHNESELPGIIAQRSEDPAVAQARASYLSGNQKLFAGDIDAAIAAYREALTLYPGYVGGYRGLGLAYAQRGDTQKALDAFKTYVATVPGAKDVALIKKRIARLQTNK